MTLPALNDKIGVCIVRRWPGGNDGDGNFHPEEQWLLEWTWGSGHIFDSPPWPGVWEYWEAIVIGANAPGPNAGDVINSISISGRSHLVIEVIKK